MTVCIHLWFNNDSFNKRLLGGHKMKIEIMLYNESGERVVGKAIETDCQSLIINGVHIIAQGGINAEMQDLMAPSTPENIGMTLVPELEPLN